MKSDTSRLSTSIGHPSLREIPFFFLLKLHHIAVIYWRVLSGNLATSLSLLVFLNQVDYSLILSELLSHLILGVLSSKVRVV